MKGLITFINWLIVAVMMIGGAFFIIEAFRKDNYNTASDTAIYCATGISCILIGIVFFLGVISV